jgi:hypothetical protein
MARTRRPVRRTRDIAFEPANGSSCTGVWKWIYFSRAFREQWLQQQIDLYHRWLDSSAPKAEQRAALAPPPAPTTFVSTPASPIPQHASYPPLPTLGVSKTATSPSAVGSDTGGWTTMGRSETEEDCEKVPRAVVGSLWQLFMSNLPADVTLNELRDFSDEFEGASLPSALIAQTNDSRYGQVSSASRSDRSTSDSTIGRDGFCSRRRNSVTR